MQKMKILSTKTILYAEDEKEIQKNIKEILQIFFKEVIVADNGEEAMKKYHEKKPDVLMLDIYMPLMDGLGVLNEVRKLDKKIPIIILSANANKENLFEIVDKKICKFLTKPFDTKKLNEALIQCANELNEACEEVVSLKNGVYEFNSKIFNNNKEKIQLTKKESLLLEYMIRHKNQALSYEVIIEFFWNYQSDATKESIKALIKEIRKKIGKDDIKNIFGIGYKLEI